VHESNERPFKIQLGNVYKKTEFSQLVNIHTAKPHAEQRKIVQNWERTHPESTDQNVR